MVDIQRAGNNSNQQMYRAENQTFNEIHLHQIAGEDAEQYLLRLLQNNFPALREEAMVAVRACMSEMVREVVIEIANEDPALLDKLRRPRVQAALVSAAESYAETADPDTGTGDTQLGGVLARLVVQLAHETTRTMADIAIRQAIEIVPKLTKRQINAMSVITMMNSLAWGGDTASDVAKLMGATLQPYFDDIPTHAVEYSYMSSCGVGTYLLGPSPYEKITTQHAAAMRKQFSLAELQNPLAYEFRESLLEPVHGQIDIWRMKENAPTIASKELQLDFQRLRAVMQFVQSLVLQPEELKTLIHAEQPELGRSLDQLEASSALFFNLNTIGLMLVKEELAVRHPGSTLEVHLATTLETSLESE